MSKKIFLIALFFFFQVIAATGQTPALRANIIPRFYDAGHQIYVHLPSLKRLKEDLADFIKKSK